MENNTGGDAVLCRYCFNLDHWVPMSLPARAIPCRVCDVCPMYVTLGEWPEHVEHGASHNARIMQCDMCPVCSGIISPNETGTLCFFCDRCQSFVPASAFELHRMRDCMADDPFTDDFVHPFGEGPLPI